MTTKTVTAPNLDRSRVKRVKAAASVNNTLVNGVPTALDGYSFYNAAAYAVFVKFYDKATAPVAGTDTPAFTVGIAAGGRAEVQFPKGLQFGTGLGFAITKLVADSDTTVVVAEDVNGVIAYR